MAVEWEGATGCLFFCFCRRWNISYICYILVIPCVRSNWLSLFEVSVLGPVKNALFLCFVLEPLKVPTHHLHCPDLLS